MRNLIAAAACAAGIALAATACSSGASSGSTAAPAASSATAQANSPTAPASAQSSTAGLTIDLKAISGIPGMALVDDKGRTLYLWEADKNGTSTCDPEPAGSEPVDVTVSAGRLLDSLFPRYAASRRAGATSFRPCSIEGRGLGWRRDDTPSFAKMFCARTAAYWM